jgi:ATP-dependent protease ClpP protease subunit
MSEIMQEIETVHAFNIGVRNREIYLYSFPSEEGSGVDFRMAQMFIKNMNILEASSKKPILIHMYSPGGSWFDGLAIFDRIKASKCDTEIVVHGYAESMSGIILQSAKRRTMSKNSYFMLHYGSDGKEADTLSFKNYARFVDGQCEKMFDIYAERCVNGAFFKKKQYTLEKTKNFLKRKLKSGDWYLSAEDALKYGFIDGING